jgi:sulfhydrogenase subunit delta
MQKIRISIVDLTDCEGCELQFLTLREELLRDGHDLEIVSWRLGTSNIDNGPYDVTFIEGSPITESDISAIKQARKVSKTIVTLGSCAVLGGVQAMLPEKSREKFLEEVYGKQRPGSKAPKPVSYYIGVDIHLAGCPVNPNELKKLLISLRLGKKFIPAYAPVCLECKASNNTCLFVEEGFCLGVVTKGGCGAPCPNAGLRCYGCFGPLPDANMAALAKVSKKSEAEVGKALKLFFSQDSNYQNLKIKKGK